MAWPVLHTIREKGKLLIHIMTYFLSFLFFTSFLMHLKILLLFWLQLLIKQCSSLSWLQWDPGVFPKIVLVIEISDKTNDLLQVQVSLLCFLFWAFVWLLFVFSTGHILHLNKLFSYLWRWPPISPSQFSLRLPVLSRLGLHDFLIICKFWQIAVHFF